MDPAHRPILLKPVLTAEFPVALKDAHSTNGNFDFPVLRIDPVDMRAHEILADNANSAVSEQSAALRDLEPAPGAVPPQPTERAVFDPQ
jgi:hypothetical protein